jgi:hypothetical protein
VQLGVRAALVRPEHDGVRRLVVEVGQVHVGLVAQELDVAAAAILASLEWRRATFTRSRLFVLLSPRNIRRNF